MNGARQIIYGPGDKLAWLESIAFDGRATPFEARVAIALSNRIDKYTGTATIGQDWLAEKVDGTERGVRDALERIARRGQLAIVHSRGRGRVNVYRPIKTGTAVPLFDPEKRSGEVLKEEPRSSKRGTGVPPLPNNYQNSSCDTGNDTRRNSGPWLSVREGIAKSIGADNEAAWFGRLSVEAVTPTEVVMHAPSAFVRQQIEGRYPDRLLIEWRRVQPSISSVRLVVPSLMRAAE